eukprot:COSAG05_NODE_1444_length_4871_cov_14.212070_3_plen_91_part_00
MHYRECHTSEQDLRDIKLDIADQVNEAISGLSILAPLTQQRLRAAVAVLRSVRPPLPPDIYTGLPCHFYGASKLNAYTQDFPSVFASKLD